MYALLTTIALLLEVQSTVAQSCSGMPTISAKYSAPSIAPGYTARIIASGLRKPRSIKFDSSGRLLVVESGKGITALSLNDQGGSCIQASGNSTVIADTSLNHGLELSEDGKILYASNSEKAMRWTYNADDGTVSGASTTLVDGMGSPGHVTRTILLSKKKKGALVVSRGSQDNVDRLAADIATGISQIRSFDVSTNSDMPQDYSTTGTRLGWGLRNSVGVAEHPISGGIYSVENSADNVDRQGTDIHTNNPGEELNFHGYLDGTKASPEVQGKNYGYPLCFAAWNVSEIPNSNSLKTGSQFQIGSTPDDSKCTGDVVAPRLTFPAHWAPLDIKFNSAGTTAWITSHGSWNRQPPTGYLLFAVPFQANGSPVAAADSRNSWTTIMSNPDLSVCPNGCFRPTALTWDSKGRLFMTSDSTGEIYVITATDGSGIDGKTFTATEGGNNGSGATKLDATVVVALAAVVMAGMML